MVRVRASKCGPHFKAGQQEGVFGDYRTVAGRLRRTALFAPAASRGETPATTGTCFLSSPLSPTDRRGTKRGTTFLV